MHEGEQFFQVSNQRGTSCVLSEAGTRFFLIALALFTRAFRSKSKVETKKNFTLVHFLGSHLVAQWKHGGNSSVFSLSLSPPSFLVSLRHCTRRPVCVRVCVCVCTSVPGDSTACTARWLG